MIIMILLLLSYSSGVHASVGRPEADIIIDVGHGGVDSGTSYHNLFEKDINLAVAKILYEELLRSGYHVILNRKGDYALSEDNRWLNSPSRHLKDLAQRKHLAVELAPQIVISLHVNWSFDSSERGPLVLYQKNNQSFVLADMIQHSLNEFYSTRKEPRAGKSYYLLKHSICPTVIVEMGFISNKDDRYKLTNSEQQRKLAKAIASGVVEYLSLMGGVQEREYQEQQQQEDQQSHSP